MYIICVHPLQVVVLLVFYWTVSLFQRYPEASIKAVLILKDTSDPLYRFPPTYTGLVNGNTWRDEKDHCRCLIIDRNILFCSVWLIPMSISIRRAAWSCQRGGGGSSSLTILLCLGDSNSQKRGREACLSCILISSFICNNADILAGKESTCNAGDPGSIPGSGSSPAEVISYPLQCSWASLVTQTVKNLPAVQRPGYNPWVGKIPWRRPWQPTPAFLPGELPWTEAPGRLQSMMSQRVTSVEWISTA